MQSQGFLQSDEWAGFQRSLGREVFGYAEEGISAKIIQHNLPFHKNYLYTPQGPVFDFNSMAGGFKNPTANFVKYLHELGKKQNSIFVKAEPLVDSVAQQLVDPPAGGGFKKSKKEIQPSKTVVIDLSMGEADLLANMHHKTRYNIQVAEKHNIKVAESNDVGVFLKLLKKTTKKDKFSAHEDSYYQKLLDFRGLDARLFLATHNGRSVAGAIILIHGNTAYYLHGASDYDYRSLMAPYALHWQIIQSLKARGIYYYDLWGIDANKWPGVTRFKLGWGGHTIEYPGSFDLPISKFWYLAYRLTRRF